MADFLVVVLVVLAVWVALVVTAALVLRSWLARGNRVAADVRSPTPVRWRWSTAAPARLHRRLQVAVWPVDPARPEALPGAPLTDDLRRQLVVEAVATDARLAQLGRAPRGIRRRELPQARARVAAIEHASARLQGAPRPLRRETAPELRELTESADALAEARAHVDRWEAAVSPGGANPRR